MRFFFAVLKENLLSLHKKKVKGATLAIRDFLGGLCFTGYSKQFPLSA
jgi:hypothetical protein